MTKFVIYALPTNTPWPFHNTGHSWDSFMAGKRTKKGKESSTGWYYGLHISQFVPNYGWNRLMPLHCDGNFLISMGHLSFMVVVRVHPQIVNRAIKPQNCKRVKPGGKLVRSWYFEKLHRDRIISNQIVAVVSLLSNWGDFGGKHQQTLWFLLHRLK